MKLTCNRGCEHLDRWCETSIEANAHGGGCNRCERDGEPTCDVGRFVSDNFADCQRRFSRHECGHLTGFTRRAFAALVHLADAAQVADPGNRPGVMAAIAALFACRSVREHESFARDMIDDDTITNEARDHLARFVRPELEHADALERIRAIKNGDKKGLVDRFRQETANAARGVCPICGRSDTHSHGGES